MAASIPTTAQPSALGEAYGYIQRYTISSNDVLDGTLKVTIADEATGKSLWHMERVLTEHEILGLVKDANTNVLRWTIHRPKLGWYIRLRSPLFANKAFVPLLPYDPSIEQQFDAASTDTDPTSALTFTCQTNMDPSPSTSKPHGLSSVSADDSNGKRREREDLSPSSVEHSYPPSPVGSPPIRSTSPLPSPFFSNESSTSSASSSLTTFSTPTTPVATQPTSPPAARGLPGFTKFYVKQLTGMAPADIKGKGRGVVSRLSALLPASLTSTFLSPRRSFSLTTPSYAYPPLLTYTDTTPLFGAYRTTGILELDTGVARVFGVEPSWWITVALAFEEFLAERDGYLAAAEG